MKKPKKHTEKKRDLAYYWDDCFISVFGSPKGYYVDEVTR